MQSLPFTLLFALRKNLKETKSLYIPGILQVLSLVSEMYQAPLSLSTLSIILKNRTVSGRLVYSLSIALVESHVGFIAGFCL